MEKHGKYVKVAYYSFSETQYARAEKFSLTPFFFRACHTWRHHREKAANTSEIWLVEIARGVLLTFFIMNGRRIEAVSERYRHKISVKPWQKPREVVLKILGFLYALFQRALKWHACLVLLTKEVAKKAQIDFLTPVYSKTDRITHSKKFRINS